MIFRRRRILVIKDGGESPDNEDNRKIKDSSTRTLLKERKRLFFKAVKTEVSEDFLRLVQISRLDV